MCVLYFVEHQVYRFPKYRGIFSSKLSLEVILPFSTECVVNEGGQDEDEPVRV